MIATLDHIDHLRPDIWTFWFLPDKPLRFIAGQYIEIHAPHAHSDSRGEHRWLTISSMPHEPLIGVTMKFVDRPSTYKQAFHSLRPGARLHLSDPIGDFVLPKFTGTPIVLMAAGIGVTPMQSMVATMHHLGEQRPVQFVHLARSEPDLLFTQTFIEAPITYMPLLTQPDNMWDGLRGRLDAMRLLELTDTSNSISTAPLATEKLFYLSGPEKLVMNIHDELLTLGIDRSQIALDYFPGYTDL